MPMLGTVPVLLSDAEAAMQRWRLRTRDFATGVGRGIAAARTELSRSDLLPATRKRIETSCDALDDNRSRILALLAEVGIQPAADDEGELESAEPTSAAGRASITDYYEQIHRDWGWQGSDDENRDALQTVEKLIGDDRDLGVIVVLGAGAGRLAYDVHHAYDAAKTILVDINPLLMCVAAQMGAGETVSLCEFPLIPRDIDNVHVLRHLRAPHGALRGWQPIVADAFALPLADASVNTVLTPWFIDQVPADARDAIGVAHRLLAPGGRWINFGPLIYPKDRTYSVRYTPSELLEIVSRSGFTIDHSEIYMAEFLRSPAAGFARIEQIVGFAATKNAAATSTDDPPQWLIAPHLPIPAFAGLADYVAPHVLLGHVAAMIDGTTSLATITQRVIHEHGIPPHVAKLGVPAAAAEIARACKSQ